MNCFGSNCGAKTRDEEAANQTLGIGFGHNRWIIDLNLHNIITTISENKTWGDVATWRKLKGNEEQNSRELGKSFRMNFAVLQRIYLLQLREKLAKQAAALRFEAEEPDGWQKTLEEYIQALQNYDYMEKRSLQPGDPFYISGENYLDRKLLEHIIGNNAGRLVNGKSLNATGNWETGPVNPNTISDTRLDNYRRNWTQGFHQRLGVATIAGIFLIAPMWLMVLHNTLYTALVSTTVFVAVFGLVAAARLTSLMEVMSSTAAYAAVLVVFVGLVTEMADSS
ncbi:hypothetical protein FMUND_6737 [Fusarium mundagurra]|uniref:DUF6594 domain-containing protein n=1 Tax=Fusarium mundagurra TaxID=1567541 RepID=A0A8H5YN01_9HYPO|nr:hypothetical protein FMUND_6737 [Fusarium mundagurra]